MTMIKIENNNKGKTTMSLKQNLEGHHIAFFFNSVYLLSVYCGVLCVRVEAKRSASVATGLQYSHFLSFPFLSFQHTHTLSPYSVSDIKADRALLSFQVYFCVVFFILLAFFFSHSHFLLFPFSSSLKSLSFLQHAISFIQNIPLLLICVALNQT